jgi:hypothetical protein
MIFCTLSDQKYLSKGLALYESLSKMNSDFKLFYLCIDEFCANYIASLNIDNLIPIPLGMLEDADPELRQAKFNPKSNYGDEYSQYCWALTPYFTNFCLINFVKDDDQIIYVDSDLYFYKSFKDILTAIGNKSIGIHTHRYTPPFREQDNGWYNCAVVVFRRDHIGMEASGNWKHWLLHIDNQYYEKYGTCGDQKYLELFPKLYPDNVSVFDVDVKINNDYILHSAPWCCDDIKGREIYWYHFSHFWIDEQGNWHDSLKGEWKPSAYMHSYYENYATIIKKIDGEITRYSRIH